MESSKDCAITYRTINLSSFEKKNDISHIISILFAINLNLISIFYYSLFDRFDQKAIQTDMGFIKN